ncbi:14918_t:CDS:2, partial [Cetraspora pellucida]
LTKNEKDIKLLDPMKDANDSYEEILLESESEELFELDAKKTNCETDSTKSEHKYNLNIPPRQATPPPFSQKCTYMDIDIIPKQVKQLKEIISQSPITKTTTVLPLLFPLNYSTTQQGILSSSKQTSQIQAHSHHAHT